MVVIKFDYEGDVRRVTVENVPPMEELKSLIASLYREKTGSYSVKYKDDDGDLITVASDREVTEAFRLFENLNTILRFQIISTQDLTASAIEREWTAEEAIHNAQCDICNQRIKGTRWKCRGCPDYDLCNRCYTVDPRPHSQHSFVRMEKRKKMTESCLDKSNVSIQEQQEQERISAELLRREQDQIRRMEDENRRLEEEKIRMEEEGKRRLQEESRLREEEQRRIEEEQRRIEEEDRRKMEALLIAKKHAELLAKEEAERMERQRMEQERIERERMERERIEREQAEQVRLERERVRIEQERLEKERIQREAEEKAKADAKKALDEKKSHEMAKYVVQLQTLSEMGFCDVERNVDLLAKYNGDVMAVIAALLN